MLRLDFLALEPDPSRWRILRSGLQALGRRGVAVSTPAELAAVLAVGTVEELMIGRCGTAADHADALALLRCPAAEGTRIRVVADPSDPRRVAQYLRLGPRVCVIAPVDEADAVPTDRAA